MKLPINISDEEKLLLKKAKKSYAIAGEMEMVAAACCKLLASDPNKQESEQRIKIKALHARISKNRNSLGEGLAALGLLSKSKPAKTGNSDRAQVSPHKAS